MEQIQETTKLEIEIVNWFVQNYPKLTKQISKAKVIKREYSGVGFFIHFQVSKNIPILSSSDFNKGSINGPLIESKELSHGAQAIFFIKEGYIDMLEMFAFGDKFPKNIKQFQFKKTNSNNTVTESII